MSAAFADASFFLALINARDEHHPRAVESNVTLAAPLVTTAWVLLELANGLAASRGRIRFGVVLERLRLEPDAEIVAAESDRFDQGCRLSVAPPGQGMVIRLYRV